MFRISYNQKVSIRIYLLILIDKRVHDNLQISFLVFAHGRNIPKHCVLMIGC